MFSIRDRMRSITKPKGITTLGGSEVSASPVTLVGNVTSDPKLEFLANGTAKMAFSIACSHYWSNDAGEKQEKTSFFNIVAWRNLAEDCANTLEKGIRVVVTGRLEQRSWDDKTTGDKRSTVEVVADSIGISVTGIAALTRKPSKGAAGSPSVGGTQTRTAQPVPARKAPAPVAAAQIFEEEEPF